VGFVKKNGTTSKVPDRVLARMLGWEYLVGKDALSR
jgi:hypothetical protein